MESKARTRKLVIMALLIALSFVGANITVFGSIAFDSLPAFFAALLLGPVYGAMIGFLGHMFTAFTSGFPLTAPMHFVIAVSMALTMLCFGCTYRLLKVKAGVRLLVTGIVGVLLNAPVSLALSIAALWLMAGREAALGLLILLPFLVMASAVNVFIGIFLFATLEKHWNELR